jgi:hypothetical protein
VFRKSQIGYLSVQLIPQANSFGIVLLCQAIKSKHFHLVVTPRPDVVKERSDEDVTRCGLMPCPERRDIRQGQKISNPGLFDAWFGSPENVTLMIFPYRDSYSRRYLSVRESFSATSDSSGMPYSGR